VILRTRFYLVSTILFALFIAACSTSRPITEGEFNRSELAKAEVAGSMNNYEKTLNSVKGKGRALVSEPGNSDRVTIDFEANKTLSLLTIQNRIGIEGGQMLVESDSILIYNRVDKVAQKISINDGRLTSLNELASINILDLLNYKVEPSEIEGVFESNNFILLRLKDDTHVYLDKDALTVQRVDQNKGSDASYSQIKYESYGELEGFILPRKITIFSTDGKSRVVFLIRSLDVNPDNLNLKITIPENIHIQRL
jgi:hypothetical protein